MDLSAALANLAALRTSALVTIKRDGRPQVSNVSHSVGADGLIRVSVTADRAKTKNAIRDPRVSLYASPADGWSYLVIEGTASTTPPAGEANDATVEALVDLYRAIQGDHPDWDDYRAAMVRDQRIVLTIQPERAYGIEPAN